MEELFRFNVARAIERKTESTLSLKRNTPFQEYLFGIVGEYSGEIISKPVLWFKLQKSALSFVKENVINSNLDFEDQSLNSTMSDLKQLLDYLKAVKPTSEHTGLIRIIKAISSNLAENQLNDMVDKLADLFLALLILRALGPAGINAIISLEHLPPAFSELLYDRPSLSELADLLRVTSFLSMTEAEINVLSIDDIHTILLKTLLLPPGLFSMFEKPVHAIGFMDLLVVKQHIARYEAGEIVRIENILKSELRDHSRKHTLSNESDTFYQTETSTETDQELTSSEHINIRNEVENTLKEGTKIDSGIHVQYDGGCVKAQADFTVAYDKASSESKKFASELAKDITQKASKKVTQKVTQSQTTKIIETFEENEDQKYDNIGGKDHIIGVYQWINKIYLAQVFNYGRHLIFDIMVPDPAASLRCQVKKLQGNIEKPTPPAPLPIKSPSEISTDPTDNRFYGNLVAAYHVNAVEPPPPYAITITAAKVFPYEDNTVKSDKETLRIDDGYAARSVRAIATWIKNDDDEQGVGDLGSLINLLVGGVHLLFQWNIATHNNRWAKQTLIAPLTNYPNKPVEERTITYAFDTNLVNEMTLNVEITCERTAELLAKWQLQTYDKIVTRWEKLQQDYLAELATFQQEKEEIPILLPADPETYRQIELIELKRSCIAILDNSYNWVRGIIATIPWPVASNVPDGIDPDLSNIDKGTWVRWFEQAFEWDKIGYVFYPYFWAASDEWSDILNLKRDDPLFLKFLQAGYARVTIPVRNGFEDAINFYMLTGIPWMGGGLPSIGDNGQDPLYLSIVEELKESSGAPGDEKPVGDPWEIHLPTTLIKLRKELDGTMPTWTRANGPSEEPENTWTWTADEPPKIPQAIQSNGGNGGEGH